MNARAWYVAAAALLAGAPAFGQAPSENTSAACRDGVDNDGDGRVDCADPECTAFLFCPPPGGAAIVSPEQTPAACRDGVDNDGDGRTDCADPECSGLLACVDAPPPPATPPPPPPPPATPPPATPPPATPPPASAESTTAACQDRMDNDGDGLVDCADSDCNGTFACGGTGAPPAAGPTEAAGPQLQLGATGEVVVSPHIRRSVVTAMIFDFIAYLGVLVGGVIMGADFSLYGAGAITIGVGSIFGALGAIIGTSAMTAWQGAYTRAGHRVSAAPIATGWVLTAVAVGLAAGAMATPVLFAPIPAVLSVVTEVLNFWLVRPWWERTIGESPRAGVATGIDLLQIGSLERIRAAAL